MTEPPQYQVGFDLSITRNGVDLRPTLDGQETSGVCARGICNGTHEQYLSLPLLSARFGLGNGPSPPRGNGRYAPTPIIAFALHSI